MIGSGLAGYNSNPSFPTFIPTLPRIPFLPSVASLARLVFLSLFCYIWKWGVYLFKVWALLSIKRIFFLNLFISQPLAQYLARSRFSIKIGVNEWFFMKGIIAIGKHFSADLAKSFWWGRGFLPCSIFLAVGFLGPAVLCIYSGPPSTLPQTCLGLSFLSSWYTLYLPMFLANMSLRYNYL